MNIVLHVVLGMLGVSAVMVAARLSKGPTDADRVVAADTLLILMTSAAAVLIAITGSTRLAPVIIVVALVGFVGTVAFARFLERRTGDGEGPR